MLLQREDSDFNHQLVQLFTVTKGGFSSTYMKDMNIKKAKLCHF